MTNSTTTPESQQKKQISRQKMEMIMNSEMRRRQIKEEFEKQFETRGSFSQSSANYAERLCEKHKSIEVWCVEKVGPGQKRARRIS